jgi:hypothetical protein
VKSESPPSRIRLFVHAGPPKTGTSAVQHLLRSHDDSVIVYPKLGLWRDGAHHNLVFNFFKDYSRPEVERIDIAAAFAQIGARARETGRGVVVSSEALFGRDVGAFIAALLPEIRAAISDVEILVVYREPFARIASLYNQAVKDSHHRETRGPSEYLRQHAAGLLYAPTLERFSRVGARVRVMNYHPESGFVARFLSHVGFPPSAIPASEARNVSLSVKGLIATLAANRIARSAEHRDELFEALRKIRRLFAPSRFIFDSAAALAVEPLFQRDRESVAKLSGLALPILDLAAQHDMFHVTKAERDEIAQACRDLAAADRDGIAKGVEAYIAK